MHPGNAATPPLDPMVYEVTHPSGTFAAIMITAAIIVGFVQIHH
jgi:hypothetical protein